MPRVAQRLGDRSFDVAVACCRCDITPAATLVDDGAWRLFA